jgi:hypothetical protein
MGRGVREFIMIIPGITEKKKRKKRKKEKKKRGGLSGFL